MKSRFYVGRLLALVFLVGLITLPLIKEATAQSPVTLEFYNPGGDIEINRVHPPRLDTLAGKTICEVMLPDNEWQTYRTAPIIEAYLANQFPTAKIISYSEFPNWREDATIGKKLKAKGCQAVIVGNAG
jgi:hypothetical protein